MVSLDEISIVTPVKYKIDLKVFYKEDAANKTTRELPSAFGNPFANAKSIKCWDNDNHFAGIKSCGKKGGHVAQLMEQSFEWSKWERSNDRNWINCCIEILKYVLISI